MVPRSHLSVSRHFDKPWLYIYMHTNVVFSFGKGSRQKVELQFVASSKY
jgi:hypothetical protein